MYFLFSVCLVVPPSSAQSPPNPTPLGVWIRDPLLLFSLDWIATSSVLDRVSPFPSRKQKTSDGSRRSRASRACAPPCLQARASPQPLRRPRGRRCPGQRGQCDQGGQGESDSVCFFFFSSSKRPTCLFPALLLSVFKAAPVTPFSKLVRQPSIMSVLAYVPVSALVWALKSPNYFQGHLVNGSDRVAAGHGERQRGSSSSSPKGCGADRVGR